MSELLDSRADVSYIAGKDWPSSWPTHTIENELVGLENWYTEWECCRGKGEREFKTLVSSEFPIAGKDWSSFWLTHLTSSSLVGIGSMPSVAKSSQILT